VPPLSRGDTRSRFVGKDLGANKLDVAQQAELHVSEEGDDDTP